MPATPIDVAGFIDSQPVGRGQVSLLMLCAAVVFMDGFDTQAIGYVAPALTQAWHIPRAALGPVFSASLVGLMLGALILGPLADRIGRKRIIILSTAAFGLGTLATVLATGTESLIAIRFATGLGVGGALPNAIALTAEFSPHRRRATMIMAMFCGFSVGAAIGGLIAAALIPAFGWPSVFVVGGIAPLLLIPVLVSRLPESPRFLALAGGRDARIAGVLSRLFPASPIPPSTRFTAQEPARGGLTVPQLFQNGQAAKTLLFWIIFFMSLLDIYFLSNWLPTFMNDLGASVSLAPAIATMFQVGGVAGALTLGRLIDRFSFAALTLIYLLAALAVALIGRSTHSIPLAAFVIFCAGFAVIGAQNGANALVATHYPTAMRATAVGWALGIGRLGSIVGPVVGGVLVAMQWTLGALFLVAAIPALGAALAAWGLRIITERPHPARPASIAAAGTAGE